MGVPVPSFIARPVTIQDLVSGHITLSESTLYFLHDDHVTLFSRRIEHHTPILWSLPHGQIDGYATLHPDNVDTVWMSQRFGFGPALLVHGTLLRTALADCLALQDYNAPSSFLHHLSLYLNTHAIHHRVHAPTALMYTCDAACEDRYTEHCGNVDILPFTEALPLVSILLPFRDAPELLKQCINQVLLYASVYPHFEIIGINNQSALTETQALMDELTALDSRIRFIDFDAPFNYAAMMNRGAIEAQGKVLIQLNNDVDIQSPRWIAQLVKWAMRDDAGAVGMRLHYPDGTLQHLGCHLGLSGHIGHLFRGRDYKDVPLAWRDTVRPVAGVTGAVLAVKKQKYMDVGGMDEDRFKIGFNDMDLCLKLQEAGYTNRIVPYLYATHHESVTRKKTISPAIIKQERKERKAFCDQYHNRLQYFDQTLSRGFDLRVDSGRVSSFLWSSSLSRRLFKTSIPFTKKRLSIFQTGNGTLRMFIDDRHASAQGEPS